MVMWGTIAAFGARNPSLYMLIASHITRSTCNVSLETPQR